MLVEAAPVPVLTPTTLVATARWSETWNSNGAPCKMDDTSCMNLHALGIVNEFRNNSGVAPFKIGTKAMLRNAQEHSEAQRRKGAIYHQSFPVEICGITMAGENVAKNHIFFADPKTPSDPVKQCVQQFENSPPHKKNMLSPRATHFVMSTIFDQDTGYIYCTQTFWIDVKYGSGECASAST